MRMMVILVFLLFTGLVPLVPVMPTAAFAVEMGISMVVNDRMISQLQVEDRMKLIMSSSGIPNTAENRKRLEPQVVSMLIDEALKIQQAEAQDIEVTDAEIEGGIETIAQQNNLSLTQFSEMIRAQGIPRRTLEDQIRAEIAWGKYVTSALRPQVNVSEFDIDAELERLKDDPKFAGNLPSRDQVLNKIGNERLGRLQARELMDLRAEAFIESRG